MPYPGIVGTTTRGRVRMLPIPGDDTDLYLSTSEVAELLGCTRGYVSTIRTRAAAGAGPDLAGFRFGRSILTRRSSVRSYLEGLEELPAVAE